MTSKKMTGMAASIILFFLSAAPAAIFESSTLFFFGNGNFVSKREIIGYPGEQFPSAGDKCHFTIAGTKPEGQMGSAKGVFVDPDWHDGVLFAILDVGHVDDRLFPGMIQLHGEAHVYVNGRFRFTYKMFFELAEGGKYSPDWVRLYLWDQTQYGLWELPDPLGQCFYIAGGWLSPGKVQMRWRDLP